MEAAEAGVAGLGACRVPFPRAAAPWDPFLHALYERPASAERQAPSQPLGGKGEEDVPRGDAEPRKATEDLATPFHLERKRTRPGRGQGPLAAGRGEVSPMTARTEVLSFHATAQGGLRRGPAEPPSRCKNGLGVWGDPSNRIRRASPREERAPRSAEARPEGLGARWAAVWDRGRSGGRAQPRLSGERTPRGAGQSPSCLRSGGQAPRVTRGSAPTESKTQGTTLFSRNSLHPGTGFFPEVRTPGTRREEIQSIRHRIKDDPPGRQSGPGRRRKTDQLRPNGNRSGR